MIRRLIPFRIGTLSLQQKITLVFLALLLPSFLITAILSINQINNDQQRAITASMNHGVALTRQQLKSADETSQLVAQVVAAQLPIIDAVRQRDRKLLDALTHSAFASEQIDTLIITDKSGVVLYQAQQPDRAGERLLDDPAEPGLAAALDGTPVSGIAQRRQRSELTIRAIEPIFQPQGTSIDQTKSLREQQSSTIIGAVIVGINLDDDFLNGLKKTTQVDSAVFLGSNLIATTQPKLGKEKQQADDSLIQATMNEQHDLSRVIQISGGQFQEYAFPLLDQNNRPIGIFSIRLPLDDMIEAQARATNTFLLSGSIMLFVAFVLALLLSRQLTAPLIALRVGARSIKRGRYDIRVPVTTRDEVGELAEDFNDMAASLRKRNTALMALYEMAHVLSSSLQLNDVLDQVLDKLATVVGFSAAMILLYDDKQDHLAVAAARGLRGDDRLIRIKRGYGLAGYVAETGEALVIPDLKEEPRYKRLFPRAHVGSAMYVPLTTSEDILGIISIGHPSKHAYNKDDLDLVKAVADEATLAIRNAKLYEATAEERRKLDSLLQSLTDTVMIVGRDGSIVRVNPAWETLTGFSIGESVGWRLPTNVSTPDNELHPDEPLITIMQQFEAQTPEYTIESADGQLKHIGASYSVIPTADGSTLFRVAVLRDISKLKELDRMKSEFVSTVSHELRTPLASIKGFSVTLLNHWDKFDDESKREFISTIDMSTDRLNRLITDLLTLSRIEAGRSLQLMPATVSPRAGVDQVFTLLSARSADHTLVNCVPGNLPPIWADPDKLDQILVNLTDNAIKYSPEGGEVRAEGRLVEGENGLMVEFSIHDQGLGIAPEDLGRLFKRFEKLEASVERQIPGTGIGLFVTRHLIEAMGGTIGVESELGAGTTFRFTLPVSRQPQQSAGQRITMESSGLLPLSSE